jgi:hypothetical protein
MAMGDAGKGNSFEAPPAPAPAPAPEPEAVDRPAADGMRMTGDEEEVGMPAATPLRPAPYADTPPAAATATAAAAEAGASAYEPERCGEPVVCWLGWLWLLVVTMPPVDLRRAATIAGTSLSLSLFLLAAEEEDDAPL